MLLYAQLATHLRYRIAAGDLEPGDPLPSLRDGAERWGISLHTVRRAYRTLAKEGLVEVPDRRRARVVERGSVGSGAAGEPERFLRSVTQLARERFGWNVDRLVQHLESLAPAPERPFASRTDGTDGLDAEEGRPAEAGRVFEYRLLMETARPREVRGRVGLDTSAPESRDVVWVVECSEWLGAELARQVREAWEVDAHPWSLAEVGDAPPGLLVSTYYHHREVDTAAGDRTPSPAFLTVELAPSYLDRVRRSLSPDDPRLLLLGVDAETTRAMARDLADALRGRVRIETAVTKRPGPRVDRAEPGVPVVCSPENWDALDADRRSRSHVFPHTSRFRGDALDRLATDRGWRRAPAE